MKRKENNMKKVSSSAAMSKGIVKRGIRIVKPDPNKRREVKRNNPVLLRPVDDGDDFMIKF